MQCPRCNVDLDISTSGEQGLFRTNVCPKCNGTWFEKGKQNKSDESVWLNIEADVEYIPAIGEHEILSCPRCTSNLQPSSPPGYEDLVVDRCDSCAGIWLDNKELEKIREVANHKRSESTGGSSAENRNEEQTALKAGVLGGFLSLLDFLSDE